MKYNYNINSEYFKTNTGKIRLELLEEANDQIIDCRMENASLKIQNIDLKHKLFNASILKKCFVSFFSAFALVACANIGRLMVSELNLFSMLTITAVEALIVSPLSYLINTLFISLHDQHIDELIGINESKINYNNSVIYSKNNYIKEEEKLIQSDIKNNNLECSMPIIIDYEEKEKNKNKTKVLVK